MRGKIRSYTNLPWEGKMLYNVKVMLKNLRRGDLVLIEGGEGAFAKHYTGFVRRVGKVFLYLKRSDSPTFFLERWFTQGKYRIYKSDIKSIKVIPY